MIWKREPALFLGLINSILALVAAFGVGLSADQTATILAVSSALLALLTRQAVTPTFKVQNYSKVEPQDHFV